MHATSAARFVSSPHFDQSTEQSNGLFLLKGTGGWHKLLHKVGLAMVFDKFQQCCISHLTGIQQFEVLQILTKPNEGEAAQNFAKFEIKLFGSLVVLVLLRAQGQYFLPPRTL